MLPDGRSLTCLGECPGTVAAQRMPGDYGFGYDPLFVPDECGLPGGGKRPNAEGRSYAQLTPAEKDAISHRGRALEALKAELPAFLAGEKTAK
jgi:XTP/dITP diphosphohydrolase